MDEHATCELTKEEKGLNNCFFCALRSSCIRLNDRGKKGPKSLKPYEILSQLGQFKKIHGNLFRQDFRKGFETFERNSIKM